MACFEDGRQLHDYINAFTAALNGAKQVTDDGNKMIIDYDDQNVEMYCLYLHESMTTVCRE
jgi:hypothetical protein